MPIIDEREACNQETPVISKDQARRVNSIKKTICFTRENLRFIEKLIEHNKHLNRSTATNLAIDVLREYYGNR